MKVSRTDPASRWEAARSKETFYAYFTNYLIDTDAGIIMDVEATSANRSFKETFVLSAKGDDFRAESVAISSSQ